MIDVSHLAPGAWEKGYLAQVSRFLPDIKAVAVHWWGQRRASLPNWLPLPKPRLVVPDEVSEETILIILSDELHRSAPRVRSRVAFKQYLNKSDTSSIPFPLGIGSAFPSLPTRPLSDRSIDIGFVGKGYPHRRAFLSRLTDHPRLRKYRIQFNCEGGMPMPDYAAVLNDTKVSLCLPGFLSPETFRYYESIKSGCIVVSPCMPANALYQPDPGFQMDKIDDADAVATVLDSILRNPEEYGRLQRRSIDAWNERYSPEAVAKRIAKAAGKIQA